MIERAEIPSARAPDFRKAIVAAPGNLLVGGDWSQIELRAAAWISGDPTLTEVFRAGRDLHTETASAIAGVPVDQVTKILRAAAKAVNFGSIDGVGPRTLAENAFDSYGVEMSERGAHDALDRFLARYSVLGRWMRQHAELPGPGLCCDRRRAGGRKGMGIRRSAQLPAMLQFARTGRSC